jgi:hypothetical protein
LSKNSNTSGITISNFKLYFRDVSIKTAWYWHKNRHDDQQKRVEESDIYPCSYSHLNFEKGAQSI